MNFSFFSLLFPYHFEKLVLRLLADLILGVSMHNVFDFRSLNNNFS